MAYKMKGNPMQRNFGIGKSPAKITSSGVTGMVGAWRQAAKSGADAAISKSQSMSEGIGSIASSAQDAVKTAKGVNDQTKQVKSTGNETPEQLKANANLQLQYDAEERERVKNQLAENKKKKQAKRAKRKGNGVETQGKTSEEKINTLSEFDKPSYGGLGSGNTSKFATGTSKFF